MFREFFIHSCIVISFLFMGGCFFRRNPNIDTLRKKLILGVLSGILGSSLMLFSITLSDNILMDLRHVAIIISGIYGGIPAVIVSTFIISFGRIVLFEIGFSTIASVIAMVCIGITIGIISLLKVSEVKKSVLMVISSTVVLSFAFIVVFNHFGVETEFYFLQYYIPTSLIGGALAVYLARYITENNKTHYEMQHLLQYDYLTGLLNVRQFNLYLEKFIQKENQDNIPFALLFIDIDHFKEINDTYGHPAGDQILVELGRLLSISTRFEDAVFRNGGEEFSILLSESDLHRSIKSAERIRRIIETHNFHLPNGETRFITVSIGIAMSSSASSSKELIHTADKALYQAKSSGRNKVCA